MEYGKESLASIELMVSTLMAQGKHTAGIDCTDFPMDPSDSVALSLSSCKKGVTKSC